MPHAVQVTMATVVDEHGGVHTGALKIALESAHAQAALARELDAYAALRDQVDMPQVHAWSATADGCGVRAILFEQLPGTLHDEIQIRLQLHALRFPDAPYPTRDSPLYTMRECWALLVKVVPLLLTSHARGYMHCDIKPSNILLDEKRNPKLADWGLSIRHKEGAPLQGPYGTDGYCLPELSDGDSVPVHFSLDSQALALTVVEMMTGMPPEYARAFNDQGTLVEYLPNEVYLRTLILSTLDPNPQRRVSLAKWATMRPHELCVPPPPALPPVVGAALAAHGTPTRTPSSSSCMLQPPRPHSAAQPRWC